MKERLEGFAFKLTIEKSNSIEFGRFARGNARKRGGKPKEFAFLGFTHSVGKPGKDISRLDLYNLIAYLFTGPKGWKHIAVGEVHGIMNNKHIQPRSFL